MVSVYSFLFTCSAALFFSLSSISLYTSFQVHPLPCIRLLNSYVLRRLYFSLRSIGPRHLRNYLNVRVSNSLNCVPKVIGN